MTKNNINLILGNRGAGKTSFIYKYFLDNKDSADGTLDLSKKFYLVVPEQDTQEKQKSVLRALASKNKNQGMLNIDVVSFDRLCYMVANELNIDIKNEKIVDDDVKKMILYRAIQNLEKEGTEFVYFKNVLHKLGFTDKLKSAMSELYSYNIDKEILEKAVNTINNNKLKLKLKELSIIEEEFKAILDNKNLKVQEDKLNLLSKLIEKSKLFNGSHVFFDGYTGFTPIQREIFGKIAEKAEDVYVTIDIREINKKEIIKSSGYTDLQYKDVFYLSKVFITQMMELAAMQNKSIKEENIIDFTGKSMIKDASLAFLEKNIYTKNHEIYKGKINISIHKCKNIESEVDYLIQNIEKLRREEDYRLNDIKVVAPNIQDYKSLIIEKCDNENINVHIDDEHSIYNSPIIEAVRSSLDVVLYNFNFDSIMRYINSGIFQKDFRFFLFDNAIRQYGLKTKEKYKTVLEKKSEKIIAKKGKINNKIYDRIEDNITDIISIKNEIINPLIELSDAFGSGKKLYKISEYIDKLKEYIEKSNINKIYDDILRDNKNQLSDIDYAVLENSKKYLSEVLGSLMLLSEGDEKKISLKEFKELLDIGFEDKKVKIPPRSLEILECGDLMKSRFDNPKVVFFLGLNDSRLPGKYSDNNIIDDDMRERLKRELDIELSQTTRETSLNQRFYVYLALSNAREKLYLSYSSKNADGESDFPASVIKHIKLLFKNENIEVAEDKENYDLYTRRDMLNYLYRHLYDSKIYCKSGSQNLKNNENMYQFTVKTKKVYDFLKNKLTEGEKLDLDKKSYNRSEYVNPVIIKDIIGDAYEGSVSKLEDFASCPYQYFLKYTIGLEERKEYDIDSRDIGVVFHKVLEDIFTDTKYDILKCDEKVIEEEVQRITNNIYEDYDKFKDSNLSRFLSERIKDILVYSIAKLKNNLSKEESIHIASEENIKCDIEGTGDILKGRIDTLDLYVDELHDLIKIVDYKSSHKGYIEDELNAGVNIQYIVYLDYVLKNIKSLLIEHKIKVDENKIKKALGTFYFNIHDKILNVGRNELESDKISEINKDFKFSGIATLDGAKKIDKDAIFEKGKLKSDVIDATIFSDDDLSFLMKKVNSDIKDRIGNIRKGEIKASPYKNESTCEYCPYQVVCKKSLYPIDDNDDDNINIEEESEEKN